MNSPTIVQAFVFALTAVLLVMDWLVLRKCKKVRSDILRLKDQAALTLWKIDNARGGPAFSADFEWEPKPPRWDEL